MPARRTQVTASDKLVFLLSLVPYLLDESVVSVADAAAHFDRTPDEVRDAVRLIAVSGVPGENAFYQANDLFDIDWSAFEDDDVIVISHHVAIDDTPRLSAREAAALVAGLQYLTALPENRERPALAALTAKLAAGAGAAPAPIAVAQSEVDASLVISREAIANDRRLEFDYLNGRGERLRRSVDPLRISSLGSDWYLQAFDHTRDDLRNFRVDRMSDVRVGALPVLDHSALEVPEALFQPSPSDHAVVVDVVPAALPLIADYLADSNREVVGENLRVTLRLAHFHGLKRLVAGLPGLVTVVAPEEARELVLEWAASALGE